MIDDVKLHSQNFHILDELELNDGEVLDFLRNFLFSHVRTQKNIIILKNTSLYLVKKYDFHQKVDINLFGRFISLSSRPICCCRIAASFSVKFLNCPF